MEAVLLGKGGVGEVYRVADPALDRPVAMKVLRSERMEQSGELERFVAEARATARLEHPGIVPVHSFGYLPDGRPYFTMKEIKGRSLREAILDFHQEVDLDPEDQRVGVGFRRLVEQLRRACEAMAYAHERGVVHRDLKPDNILVGPWGEVLVVDWGLSICISGQFSDMPGVEDAVEGTAIYMAPELAINEGNIATPASDVYSLGAVLYAILCGKAPYRGSALEVLEAVAAGAPPLPNRASFQVPEDLLQVCLTAMSRNAADRYPDAGVLEAELGAWLEGAVGREKAWRAVQQAEEMGLMVERLRASARQLRDQSEGRLAGIHPGAPLSQKLEAWALEDEAERLETEAGQCEEEELAALKAALTHAPGLVDVHERLAAHYHARHQAAEMAQDVRTAARLEVLLRAHNRGRYDSYLRGIGAISLRTDPVDAEVQLYRVERRQRLLVPVFVKSLGRTPLAATEIPIGSYQLRVLAEGFAETRLLLRVERALHQRIRPPGGKEHSLKLLKTEDVGGACYVASGFGAAWGAPFVVSREPITAGNYQKFLVALQGKGLTQAAEELAPEKWPEGADLPITGISWEGVRAYAAWMAAKTGKPWRPLAEGEWLRLWGADGRRYPWGDRMDPAFCALKESAGTLQPVSAFPTDESPYGPVQVVGNVREWCSGSDGPVACGASYRIAVHELRLDQRPPLSPKERAPDLGFRLAWSV